MVDVNQELSQFRNQASQSSPYTDLSNQSLPNLPSSPPIGSDEMIKQLQRDLQSYCSSQLDEKFRLIQDRLLSFVVIAVEVGVPVVALK